MSDPRPPSEPLETATGEWSSGDERKQARRPDSPTLTNSGTGSTIGELGIPNPFGRYAITKLLGRGGMGAVFLAHDSQLERPVAIKIPTFRGTLTDTQKERFRREARAISALRHPNICPVFDVDEEQGFLFLTMAYIEGQSLSTVIERGPMQPPEAVELIRRVAQAMQVAHTHGTIHRDLKPANILIDKDGEPVVMDFGLARRATWGEDSKSEGTSTLSGDAELTQDGSVLGTPAYMPPEQARGDMTAIGTRSDIYALGVILYELLTGRRPFVADDTAELIRQIQSDPPPKPTDFYPWIERPVEKACLKALAKDPADRFTTMAEFEQALKQAVEPELTVVVPPPLPPSSSKQKRIAAPPPKSRRKTKILGCLAIVALLLTICIGGPVAVVLVIINKAKEFTDNHQQASAEWDAIVKLWNPPAADADAEVLLPATLDNGKFKRLRQDTDVADAEFGIAMTGHHGVYKGPDGEVEVRVYRCTELEALAIERKVHDLAQARMGSQAGPPGSVRHKAVYANNNSSAQTVTYGFHDSSARKQEYGKLWCSHGWLFWFQTAQPLQVEFFPSKYLMEVGKRAAEQKK